MTEREAKGDCSQLKPPFGEEDLAENEWVFWLPVTSWSLIPGGMEVFAFFIYLLLPLTIEGMRSPLSAGPRRGERVYVSVCLFWTPGATEKVELLMQHSWQKKTFLI